MIKARLTFEHDEGYRREVVLFGLSRANIERLLDDRPILFPLRDMGDDLPDLDIVIMAGETEADLKGKLSPMMTPETKEHYG